MSRTRWLPYATLAGGVAVVSIASILIRYAQSEGTASLTIAALRMSFAALLLAPFTCRQARRELTTLSRSDLLLVGAAGLVLATHFAAWITSLEYTSVASSAVLVTTNPVWVGVLSWLVLRERPGFGVLAGIVLGLCGSALVFVGEPGMPADPQRAPLLGNSLALGGAMAVSVYLLIGRRLRARVSLWTYVFLVYSTAAVALLLAALLAGASLWPTPVACGLILLLAAGPQLLGHTAFNHAVRHLPAPLVAVAILGEPIGAAVLAWLLFGEAVNALQLAGFGLLLAGIVLAAVTESRRASPAPATPVAAGR